MGGGSSTFALAGAASRASTTALPHLESFFVRPGRRPQNQKIHTWPPRGGFASAGTTFASAELPRGSLVQMEKTPGASNFQGSCYLGSP